MRLEPELPLHKIDKEEGEITESEKEEEEEEEEEENVVLEYDIPPERQDIFTQIKEIPLPPLLPEETQKQAKDIRVEFNY